MNNNIQLKHNETAFETRLFPICVLANNIQLAGNIGSLFRIADTFGIERLYFSGLAEETSNLKIRKAARSTHKKVDYRILSPKLDSKPSSKNNPALELITGLKKDGYTVICLEITSKSLELRKFVNNLTKLNKTCLIIGSEKTGIDQTLLDIADHTLHIPMFGDNSSMNVTTATAIALYELTQLPPDNTSDIHTAFKK